MSRHRDIRNLDVDAELEDDALSDGGDELTEEQEAQMNEAFESVRSVIGDAMIADLSERSIREALWELYFDVEQTVEWAFSEHERKRVAQERKDLDPNYSAGSDDGQQWSRMPKIMQAQPEGGYLDLNEPQIIYPNRLSTITERTEKTEVQSMFTKPESTVDQYLARTRSEFAGDMTSQSVDPSTIPVSPSASAVQRLSLYEVPPSNPSTLSRSSVGDPRQSTESVPAIEVIPDIPDFQSKSSKPPVRAPTTAKAPSKLSKLASSRASAISNRSESTRSTGTSTSGTTQTFSVLRPSAESRIGLSSTPGSAISKDLPPVPDASDQGSSVSSSIVRKAIENALRLEEIDKTDTPKRVRETPMQSAQALQRRTPSPTKQPSKTPTHLSRLSSSASSASSASSNKTLSSHKTSSTVKPMSKLALLAQQKVDASRGPKLPEPTTEYLTPIANGSSVTTAITTSYQTLYSLTDPTRSNVIPRLNVVPLQPPGSAPPKQISSPVKPPPAAKTSKLAMKAKRAQERSQMPPSPPALPEPEIAPPVLPIFQPSPVHARASPSAFASLLVDNANPHTEGAQTEPSWIGPDFNKPFSEKAPGSSRNSVVSVDTVDSHPHRHRKKKAVPPPSSSSGASKTFAFDSPSPDDIVMQARQGTGLRKTAAKEKEKAARLAAQAPKTQAKKKIPGGSKQASGASTPVRQKTVDMQQLDIAGMNLEAKVEPVVEEPPPKLSMAREKLVEEARKAIEAVGKDDKKGVSIVVIGHVDAGKSTLMGRLLYDLGRLDEKTRRANEKGSSNAGKSSFLWAWGLDGTLEERERGITMDIAVQTMSTPHRQITVLDAPGHKDFVPNMISGASQADCAVLVIDSTVGEFESGFERGGQTREHLLLVRSLGVSQVIVAVNKLDTVSWSKARFDEIVALMKPFLVQSGFHPSKVSFVPVGAMAGINLLSRDGAEATELRQWYSGPTLVDLLDSLEPPTRDIYSPLRFPIANVFKGQGQGAAVSGRIITGVVQVGEKLRVLPGDETCVVKSIEVDEETASWAAAGSNVNIQLTSIDPVNLIIGSVLCPPTDLVPLATSFIARIIVFDIQVPITSGSSIEVYHHSRDVPATATKLLATLDRANGSVIKANPRVITKGTSAELQLTLRSTAVSGAPSVVRGIPMEPFSVNKDMGRILIRRGGETIAAGIVLEIIN